MNDNTVSLTWVRLGAFRRYSYLLRNLVKKDITTKYQRSVLGILWSVLNPLLMMGVITVVFNKIFRIQVENFPIYYLTGSMIFNFMSEATSNSLMSILGASALIKKVYIPKYIFPFEKCVFALVNTLFSFAAVLLIMPILGVQPTWTTLLFLVPMVYTLIFSIGVGMVLASVNVFFRDLGHLYSVLITAWMYLTPIMYPIEILPERVMPFVKLNPMLYYVNYFRDVVMYNKVPGLYDNLICLSFAALALGFGLIVFKRQQDRFILYI